MSVTAPLRIFAGGVDQPTDLARPVRQPAPPKTTALRAVSASIATATALRDPQHLASSTTDIAAVAKDIEQATIDIITAAPRLGETHEAEFRRKEHELGTLFATLGVIEARALHQRLARTDQDDLLAVTFGRLVAERRARLLEFLADVRRRKARTK